MESTLITYKDMMRRIETLKRTAILISNSTESATQWIRQYRLGGKEYTVTNSDNMIYLDISVDAVVVESYYTTWSVK